MLGEQKLNGEEALVYSRMRYQDPEGDYGSSKTPAWSDSKVVEKILSLNSVSHYQEILKALSDNMQTNIEITTTTIPQLMGYQDSFKNIETQQLRGEGEMIDGISYQIVSGEHILEMQNLLRRSLGQPEVTNLETNIVLYENLFGHLPPSSEESE